MADQGDKIETLRERYITQVSESIQNLFELTTRIDERMQLMTKKQDEMDKKLESQTNTINSVGTRTSVLESKSDSRLQEQVRSLETHVHQLDLKVQELESCSTRQEARWKTVAGYVMQIAWIILTAFLLYKLGLQGS
jgi:predicted nuclease with TOPRIM domain